MQRNGKLSITNRNQENQSTYRLIEQDFRGEI